MEEAARWHKHVMKPRWEADGVIDQYMGRSNLAAAETALQLLCAMRGSANELDSGLQHDTT